MYFYRMSSFTQHESWTVKARSLFAIMALFLSPCLVQGQQVVLNTRGERIVVYPDGSWRYYERGDSILINKNLIKKDIGARNEKDPAIPEKSRVNPKADSDISALANRFAERVVTETLEARQVLTNAVQEKFEAEARLNQAQENRKLIEPDLIANLDDEYEIRTLAVKSARKHVKWMEKMYASVEKMLALPVQKKPKTLNKLIAEYDSYVAQQATSVKDPPVVDGSKASVEEKKNVISKEKSDQSATSAAPSSAPGKEYRRAPAPCTLIQPKSMDGSKSIMSVERQLLFTHTDEDLRPYFRQQELVTCYASLMQIENNLYLSLEFQIASPDARRNFGTLDNNSMLRLRSIDGIFINLFNASADQGKIDPYTGNTIYTGNYLIDRETEKLLSKIELDKIRAVWSTGFEDYDIVNLDFLINQFRCLRHNE
jgi:hypothetical protein